MTSRGKKVKPTPSKQEEAGKSTPVINKDFKKNAVIESLGKLQDYLTHDIPPGSPWIPMHYVINANKGTMMIYLFGIMCYFDNFSLSAWMYLALHGNYGIVWFIKDRTFPDSFESLCTTLSFLVPLPTVLIPYYFIGYWMMSGTENRDPSPERIFVAIQLYCLGVVFMVLTDAQKYLVLRERRGLITHCMMGWSRNMNYVGEMMLYASFAVLC